MSLCSSGAEWSVLSILNLSNYFSHPQTKYARISTNTDPLDRHRTSLPPQASLILHRNCSASGAHLFRNIKAKLWWTIKLLMFILLLCHRCFQKSELFHCAIKCNNLITDNSMSYSAFYCTLINITLLFFAELVAQFQP